LSRVRDAERHARAPEHLERARARLPVAADLQRRRALRDPPAQGRAAHLLAAPEGLLLPDAREVRDPRLPPACLLLLPRLPDDDARARARNRRGRAAADGERDHNADDRPRGAPADLGVPVHALRHVVRHGVEQGPRRARAPPDRPPVAMLPFILALLTLCVAAATGAAALRLRSFVSFLLATYLFASAGIVLSTEVLSLVRR